MAELMSGEEISRILASTGNVVKCVLLRAAPESTATDDDVKKPAAAAKKQDGESNPSAADEETTKQDSEKIILKDLIDEIEVDTTPKKSQAQKVLGGPITFLGQYEDEDLVLVVRRPESLEEGTPWNPHKLQPPFENTEVQGNILIMRTKPHDDEDKLEHEADGSDVPVAPSDNDDFFLDFTKDDYIHFALRDDVEPPEFQEVQSDDEEEEIEDEEEEEIDDEADDEYLGEDDSEDDEEAQVSMMNLIMAQVLRRFHDENGRGPNTQELLELRSALAQKLGVEVPEIEDDAEGEGEEKTDDKPSGKRAAEENDRDEGETKRVKFSQEAVEEEPDQKQDETDS